MDKKTKTVDSYNKSALAIADKFDGQGARVEDIEEIFGLVKKLNPKVLEIGCGNGRDAAEIVKHTDDYLGIDISDGLIKLAREKVSEAKFEVADIEEFEFPQNLDIIIAFASLLHVNKENFKNILERAFKALGPGGIFYISIKYADSYKEVEKEDQFGVRTFYLYSESDMREIVGDFKIIKMVEEEIRNQIWMEVILEKN